MRYVVGRALETRRERKPHIRDPVRDSRVGGRVQRRGDESRMSAIAQPFSVAIVWKGKLPIRTPGKKDKPLRLLTVERQLRPKKPGPSLL